VLQGTVNTGGGGGGGGNGWSNGGNGGSGVVILRYPDDSLSQSVAGLTGQHQLAVVTKATNYCRHRQCQLGIMAHYAFIDANNVVTEVITALTKQN
jgi:hypothetical protein